MHCTQARGWCIVHNCRTRVWQAELLLSAMLTLAVHDHTIALSAHTYNHNAGADPYCIVKVGRQKAVTPFQKNTLDPNFNCKVMFFISNPGSAEVSVEVSTCTCMNSWSTWCLHCPRGFYGILLFTCM